MLEHGVDNKDAVFANVEKQHQVNQGAVLENSEVFALSIDESAYEFVSTKIEIEEFNDFIEGCNDTSHTETEEQLNFNDEEDDTKWQQSCDSNEASLADFGENHGVNESMASENVLNVRKRGRQENLGSKKEKRNKENKDETYQPVFKSFEIKGKIGRPRKSQKFDVDIVTKYLTEHSAEISIRKSERLKSNILYCDMCPNLTFYSKRKLIKHMRHLHNPQRRKCEICNRTPICYERHIIRHHTSHAKCTLCPAVFRHTSGLKIHMLNHEKVKPHLCASCGQSFVSWNLLSRHEITMHSDVRKFPCDQCDRGFNRKYQLRNHINSFHSN